MSPGQQVTIPKRVTPQKATSKQRVPANFGPRINVVRQMNGVTQESLITLSQDPITPGSTFTPKSNSMATQVLYATTPPDYFKISSPTLRIPVDTSISIPVGLLACQRESYLCNV